MSPVNLVLIALFGGLLVLAKKAIELALENEYASWAPALARLWVRCAGLMCRSHREQWWADLLYLQRVERISGLMQATSCLVSAPLLALRDTATTVRTRRRRAVKAVLVDPAVFKVDTHRPIEELGLSSRTARMLRAHRVATVDQLLSMREEELFRIRNFGRTALNEVKEKIVERGFIQPS